MQHSINGNDAVPALSKPAEHFISCTLLGTGGISKAECPFDPYHHFSDPCIYSTTVHENGDERRAYYDRFEGNPHLAGEYQYYLEVLSSAFRREKRPFPI